MIFLKLLVFMGCWEQPIGSKIHMQNYSLFCVKKQLRYGTV